MTAPLRAALAILLAAGYMAAAWPSAADSAKQLAYGKHLSAECTTCHRLDGVDNGIPSIVGWKAEDFVDTLNFYKSGARDNQAMKSVADSLDDQQILALATYFGTLKKAVATK